MKQKVKKCSVKIEIEQVLEIQERRTFSEVFKRSKVSDLVSKRTSIQQLRDLYGISRTTVYNWLYLYSPHHSQKSRQIIEMESEATKTAFFQNRVAELERSVGQKQLEIDFLQRLIAEASAELGIDLKKNFSIRQSNGIEPTAIYGK